MVGPDGLRGALDDDEDDDDASAGEADRAEMIV